MAYFAVGVARVLRCNEGSHSVAHLALSEEEELLAVVTSNGVQVWDAGQHRVKLGELERSAASLEAEGVNVRGVWRADRPSLAVLTSAGRVHVYEFSCEEALSAPAAGGPQGERVTELAGWAGGLAAGTERGCVALLDWSLRPAAPALAPPAEAAAGAAGRLLRLALSERGGAAAAVWEGGAAAALWLGGSAEQPRLAHAGWLLRAGALSCALCAAAPHAAVGTAAAVHIVALPPSAAAAAACGPLRTLRTLRTLSLSDWGFSPADSGGAGSLAWSPCGGVLAVGYRGRGAALWTGSGVRLTHLLPRTAGRAPPAAAAAAPALLEGGVSALAWAGAGGGLLLATEGAPGALLEQPLARAPPQLARARLAPGAAALALLLLPSALLLLEREEEGDIDPPRAAPHAAWAASATDPPPRLRLRLARLPREYAAANWPLRLAAASGDGAMVAAAGRRGLALYSRRAAAWRLFGDVAQERGLCAAALAWVGDAALACVADLAAAADEARPRAELRLYPRAALQDAQLLLRAPLGAKAVLALDALAPPGGAAPGGAAEAAGLAGAQLLLLRPPCELELYALAAAGGGRRPPLALQPLSWLAPAPPPGFAPRGALLAPARGGAAPRLLLLGRGGELGCAAEGGLRLLARGVEQLWLPQHEEEAEEEEEEEAPWWLYGASGLRLMAAGGGGEAPPAPPAWADKEEGTESDGAVLALDREAWPLGLAPRPAALLWLAQHLGGPSCAFGAELPAFSLAPSAQPVLPALLTHLLARGRDGAAGRCARAAEGRPHFIHSLEWLLFSTLDAHVARARGGGGDALARAVALIADFPESPDVVVSVARKTDEREWRALFAAAGSPSALFAAALGAGRPRTAACCLLLIDTLEGPRASQQAALHLLRAALRAGCEYTLAGELVRFLGRSGQEAARCEAEAAAAAAAAAPRRGLLGALLRAPAAAAGGAEAAHSARLVERVAEALEEHAAELLRARELRRLLALQRASAGAGGAFSLADWLEASRGAACARLGDLAAALNAAAEAAGELEGAGGAGAREELEALLSLFARLGMSDWASLVACLLHRRSFLRAAAERDPELGRRVAAALRSPLLRDAGGRFVGLLAALEGDLKQRA